MGLLFSPKSRLDNRVVQPPFNHKIRTDKKKKQEKKKKREKKDCSFSRRKKMTSKNFNLVVFTGDTSKGNQGYIKYRKQNNLNRILAYLDKTFPLWVFANIQDQENGAEMDNKKSRPALSTDRLLKR